MKKLKLEKQFLEELTKVPNISIACERLTLSRQTVYRWMSEDASFKESVELAIFQGVESINDLAESKLIANIKSGNQRSIEYWLVNNKKVYHKPKPTQIIEQKKQVLGKKEKEMIDKALNDI